VNRIDSFSTLAKSKSMSRFTPIYGLLLLVSISAPLPAQWAPDFLMEKDPEFHDLPQLKEFSSDFREIWAQALERSEADYQRMAAATVARAHEYGFPELIQLAPRLEKILAAAESHPAARYAAGHALIVVDSRDSAAELFEAGQRYGSDLRQLVEPALARWDFTPARAIWLARLESPRTFPRDLILALRGLGHVRDNSALSAILELATDPLEPAHIRLEAATAAGEISDSGLEQKADHLARDRRSNPLVNRLCAVRLLVRHTSAEARRVLLDLAADANPSLVAAALERLNAIDPELVVPLAAKAMQNTDAQVRRAGAFAYLHRPSPDRVKPLARLLADDHPTVREEVAEGLYRLAAKPELGEAIRTQTMQILTGDRWQGQVQAMLVLGKLEYKPAADRLVQLLESERADVMIHAAWALRKVAVAETVPPLIDRAKRQTERRRKESPPGLDEQVAHLFEAIGVLKAGDAAPLLAEYIPKTIVMGKRSRDAALWAIGRLNEGKRNPELEEQLADRLLDFDPMRPERAFVKQMCAIALARMHAVERAPMLRGVLAKVDGPTQLAIALRWTLKKLTGDELPPPKPSVVNPGTWFLEPVQ
jgi:HEAT repeat protein